jgi:hypothetical protein
MFVLASLNILTVIIYPMFREDGMDMFLFKAVGYIPTCFFICSWWIFMKSWRLRRKALVVWVLSWVLCGYQLIELESHIHLAVCYVLLALVTLPVIYYQGLSTEAN